MSEGRQIDEVKVLVEFLAMLVGDLRESLPLVTESVLNLRGVLGSTSREDGWLALCWKCDDDVVDDWVPATCHLHRIVGDPGVRTEDAHEDVQLVGVVGSA